MFVSDEIFFMKHPIIQTIGKLNRSNFIIGVMQGGYGDTEPKLTL